MLNFDFMMKHIPDYIKAIQLTVELAFLGITLSIIIGFICSIILYFKVKLFKNIVLMYIELSRNTPFLIHLFFLYYGLPQLGIKITAFTCAVIGLTFLGGSYMAEAFRSGLEAVSKNQIELGKSIGLTNFKLIRYVIFPQSITVALPSIFANSIFLLKEVSIVSAIALADLMFVAKDLIGMYYKTTEALTMLVISYLIILLPLSLIFSFIERKVRYREFGHSYTF